MMERWVKKITCNQRNTSIENENVIPCFFAIFKLFQFHFQLYALDAVLLHAVLRLRPLSLRSFRGFPVKTKMYMKLSVSNKNPAMSAVRDPALFAAVFAIPLRSPAYSGAKSFGLLFTATAWNASNIIPTVMIVNAQITEHPMIIIKKNSPPPTKKPRKAKIRLFWNTPPHVSGHGGYKWGYSRPWNS